MSAGLCLAGSQVLDPRTAQLLAVPSSDKAERSGEPGRWKEQCLLVWS